MKYSIHLMTSHKNDQRQRDVLDTWLAKRENYIFYTDKSTGIGNQVEVDPDDTYTSNGKKNLKELIRVYDTQHYESVEWMLFCDDDTCVNLKALERLLPKLDQRKMYGSLLKGTWPNDTSLEYLSGGAGYLISTKTLESKGPPSLDYLNTSFYSDVCVGLWARDNQIEMVDVSGFHSQAPEHYNCSDEDICKSISFHYIKDKKHILELRELFE